ncbi:hypothetical protein GGQ84_002135 [Desulfitispora alkaliphila]|uniref:Cof-type HAD-IIB family hydrolase n=1 Tax=Desulfitispora alkaliphila TaxID=622674 RepID=UPI003D1F84A5
MSKGIRLIAVDLDDSLLDDNFEISHENIEAIEAARDKGIEVTIATGRMYRSALPYAKQLKLSLPIVTYQGAMIKDFSQNQLIYHQPVDLPIAKEIAAECHQMGLHLNTYIDDSIYVAEETEEGKQYQNIANVPMETVGPLTDFMEKGPTKMLVIAPETRLNELSQRWQQQYETSLYLTKSKPNFLEIMDKRVNKGVGLLKVTQDLGIYNRDEIMVIGDSYNDIPMFEIAGISVAMDNARSEVKDQATHVTRDNKNSGVAKAIADLVL